MELLNPLDNSCEPHCGEIKTLEEADRVVGLLNAVDNWWEL